MPGPRPHAFRPALGCALAVLLALLAAPGPAAAFLLSGGGGDAPAPYERLYKELAQGLLEFQARLAGLPAPAARSLRTYATLDLADGRRGRALLEGSMDACLAMLDACKGLGVQGAAVVIPYPMLLPDQPRAREYREFYMRLAREARRRGLGLYVRMTPVFHNPAFFPQRGEARTGPLDLLARAARAQVEIVLADLAPDVLGLLDEPTAAADNADLPDLAKPEALGGFLDAVTRDLVHNGTSLAVGLGSWEEPELAAVLAAAPGVELLDIHVSALRSRQTDFLVQADEYAQMAQLLGKRAALGAVWLSKSSSFTLSSRRARWLPADQDIVRLDVYGFWSPLDAAFLRLMARLARARDLEFLCPASSAPLFTYLEYDSHMERTAYPALARFFERAVYQEARAEHLSRTGRVFRDIVRGVLP